MNKEEFDKYVSDGYAQIPVYEEFVADLISPLYVFSNYFNLKNFGNKPADFMLIEERLKDGSIIYRPQFVEKRIRLSGDTVKNATVSYDPMTGSPGISLEFDDLGKKSFGRVTDQYSPKADGTIRRLAIILDNKLYSAPRINEAIYGGRAEITGNFSTKEARQLVNVLRANSFNNIKDYKK